MTGSTVTVVLSLLLIEPTPFHRHHPSPRLILKHASRWEINISTPKTTKRRLQNTQKVGGERRSYRFAPPPTSSSFSLLSAFS